MSISIPYGELEARYEAIREAVDRVRDIHSPSKDNEPGCMGCGTDPDHWDDWRETWPCPTIRALDGEMMVRMHAIHDLDCYGIPCVCKDCECRKSDK